MEHIEARKKKLKAGKEKLAAFQKKKMLKSTKIVQNDGKDDKHQNNEDGFSPDQLSPSTFSVHDSDIFSFTSGDEWSAEESDQNSPMHYQTEQIDCQRGPTDIAETAWNSVISISEAAKQINISDVETALAERDILISRLTQSLQSSLGLNIPLKDDIMIQINILVEHILTLQNQLQQADQSLLEQLELHESSTFALQAAKEQMLQLQAIINYKDAELQRILEMLENSSKIIHSFELKETNAERNLQQVSLICEQHIEKIKTLEGDLSKKTLDAETYSNSQREWIAREEELSTLLSAKTEEVSTLLASQQMLDVGRETQLEYQNNRADQELLEVLESQLGALRLEHEADSNEISSLKKVNMELETKLSEYSRHLSVCTSHSNDYDTLSQHSECLSQIKYLKSLNLDLQDKISSLSNVEKNFAALDTDYKQLLDSYQKVLEKSTKSVSFTELNSTIFTEETSNSEITKLHSETAEPQAPSTSVNDYQHNKSESNLNVLTQYIPENEALNSKIIELQTEICRLQATNKDSDDNACKGLTLISQLQQEIEQKDEYLKEKLFEIAEMQVMLHGLRCSYECVENTLASNGNEIESLTERLAKTETDLNEAVSQKLKLEYTVIELQLRLQEKDLECRQHTENIVNLQDQLLSAQHSSSLEVSEREHQLESVEEHLAALCSEKTKQGEKMKDLEQRLKIECQQYMDILHRVETEKENECRQYTENIVALQDKLLSLQQAHNVSMSEKEYQLEKYEEEMENFGIEKGNLVQRVKELEHRLNLTYQQSQEDINLVNIENDAECKKYTENIIKMQDELISSHYIHDLNMSENKAYFEYTEKEIEALEEQKVNLSAKSIDLEQQLRLETELRKEMQENKTKIESQLQVIIADREILLKTVESLTTEVHFLKKHLQSTNEHSVKQDHHDFKVGNSFSSSDVLNNIETSTKRLTSSSSYEQKVIGMLYSGNTDVIEEVDNPYLQVHDIIMRLEHQQNVVVCNQVEANQLIEKMSGMSVNELIQSQAALQAIAAELIKSQSEFTNNIESFIVQMKQFEMFEHDTKILQKELLEMKTVQNQMSEKVTSQEELQAQLEDIICQWQKLQFIVQEKEIQLLKLQEDLDEQKRICLTLKRTYEEQRCTFEEEVESFQSVSKQKCQIAEEKEIDGQKSHFEANSQEIYGVVKSLFTNEESINVHDTLLQKEAEIVDLKTLLSLKESEKFQQENELQKIISELRRSLAESQSQVVSAEEKLNQRESEINILKSNLYDNIEDKEQELGNNRISFDTQIKDLMAIVSERELEINNLRIENAEKVNEICDLKNKIKNISSKITYDEECLADKNSELNNLKVCLTNKDSEIFELKSCLQNNYAELYNLQNSISHKESEITMWKSSFVDKESDYVTLKNNLVDLEEKKQCLQNTLTYCELEVNDLKSSQYVMTSEIVALKDALSNKDSEMLALKKNLNDSECENNALKCNLSDMESKLSALNSDLNIKESDTNVLKNKVLKKKSKLETIKSQLKNKESEIEALQSHFANKDPEINDLKSNITNNKAEIEILNRELTNKELEIETLKNNLHTRELDLETMKSNLANRESEIDILNGRNVNYEVEIDALKLHLVATEPEMKQLKSSLADRELEIGTMKSHLMNRESETETLKNNLTSRELEIENLKSNLTNKESEIEACKNSFTNKELEVETLKCSLTKKGLEIDALQYNLKNKESEVETLKTNLTNKDLEIDTLQYNLKNKESEVETLKTNLTNKDLEIGAWKNSFTNKESEVETMKTNLTNKNLEIGSWKNSFTNKESEIETMKTNLSIKESEIETLQINLTIKESEIENLKSSLTNRESETEMLISNLANKQSEIDVLVASLSDKEAELMSTKSSFASVQSEIKVWKACNVVRDSEVFIMNNNFAERNSLISNNTTNEAGFHVYRNTETEILAKNISPNIEKERNILSSYFKDNKTEIDTLLVNHMSTEAAMILQKEHDEDKMGITGSRIRDNPNKELDMVDKADVSSKDRETDVQDNDNVYVKTMQDLASEISNKDLELENTKMALNEKEIEMSNLMESLLNIEMTLQSLQQGQVEKDCELEVQKNHLKQMEFEIHSLRTECTSKVLEMDNMKGSLVDKESEIEHLKCIIAQQSEELELGKNVASEMEQKVNKVRQDLSDAHVVVSGLENDFRIKETELGVLASNLANRDAENDSLRSSIATHQLQISNIVSDLHERESTIVSLQNKIEEKECEIKHINNILNIKDLELNDTKHTFSVTKSEYAETKSFLTELELKINSLQVSLSEKEVEVHELKISISDKESEIVHLKNSLTNKNLEISNVKSSFEEKQSEVIDLKSKVNETLSEMDKLSEKLNEREEKLSQTEQSKIDIYAELDKIKQQLEENNTNVKRDLAEKDVEINTLKDRIVNLECEADILQTSNKKLEEQLLVIKDCVKQKESEVIDYTDRFSKEVMKSEKLQTIISDKNNDLSAVRETIAKKESENNILVEGLHEANFNVDRLNTMLMNTNKDITSLKCCILEKEAEICNLNQKLNDEFKEKLEVTKKLTEVITINEELVGIKATLVEKELEIENLIKNCNESNNQFDIVRNSLDIANDELRIVKNDVLEKQHELNLLADKFNSVTCQLESVHVALDNANEELTVLRSSVLNKDAEICALKAIIGEADKNESKMNLLTEELSNFSAQMETLNAALVKTNEELIAVKSSVVEKDNNISVLAEELNAANNQVGTLNAAVVQANEELACVLISLEHKDTEIYTLTEKLNEASAQTASLKTVLENNEKDQLASKECIIEKECEFNELSQRFSETNHQLNTLHVTINNTNEELEAIKSLIKDKESENLMLEQKLDEISSLSEILQSTVNEKEAKLQSLTQETSVSQSQVVTFQKQFEALEFNLQEVRTENCSLKSELHNNQEHKEELKNIINQTEKESMNQTTLIANLEQEIKTLSLNLETARTVEQQFKMEIEKKQNNFDIVKENDLQILENMNKSLAEKESAIEELKQMVINISSVKEQLLQELNKTERNNHILKVSLSNIMLEVQEKCNTIIHQELNLQEQSEKLSLLTNTLNITEDKLEEITKLNTSLHELNEDLTCKTQVHLDESVHQREAIEQQVREMEDLIAKKESEVEEMVQCMIIEKREKDQLSVQLIALESNYKSLLGFSSYIQEDMQRKEATVVEQKLLIDDQSSKLNDLSNELTQSTDLLKNLTDSNIALLGEVSILQECKNGLEQEVLKLQNELDAQELTATQFMVEGKHLNEKLTLLMQDIETKEATIFDLRHDCEMFMKEVNDLKQELEQKDLLSVALNEKVESAHSLMERSREEKEMLKANFDSCIEEMQQKLDDQEIEIKRLRSQITEETKNVSQDQIQMKDIYEHQIGQMEEKLLHYEKQCERLDKELTEVKAKSATAKEVYEHQLSEQELHLQSTNSELSKLKDNMLKVTNNHKCEIAGLKRLHEIQTNELEETCVTLERTVSEQKRSINENTTKYNREKNAIEQSYEIQLFEVEEKRRSCEHEITRLKKYLDEIKLDHEKDVQSIEKSCETRLYELEDKYCSASNELERLRKSLMCTTGNFSEEKQALEMKIHELESVRRDLQNKNAVLEDNIVVLKEEAIERDDEMRTVLKNAAEKQQNDTLEMTHEISQLQHQLSICSQEHADTLAEIKKEYDTHVIDLTFRNEQLEQKINSLEMIIDEDSSNHSKQNIYIGEDKRPKAEISSLQRRITLLEHENISLNKRLSSQKSHERSVGLSPDDDAICPPYSHTASYSDSLRSENGDYGNCFSQADNERPIIEGFVAEPTVTFPKHHEMLHPQPLNKFSTSTPKSDFVEEQCDEFQPEMTIGSANHISDHPIHEGIIREGFEPESPDRFLIESTEDSSSVMIWQHDLSVGVSPSHLPAPVSFDFRNTDKTQRDEEFFDDLQLRDDLSTDFNFNCNSKDGQSRSSHKHEHSEDRFEKQLKHIKEELEEEYVTKMRQQQLKITLEYEAKQTDYRTEMEQHFEQRMKAVRYDWERKFNKALLKVKKEIEKKHMNEIKQINSGCSSDQQNHITLEAENEEKQLVSCTEESNEKLSEDHQIMGNQENAETTEVFPEHINLSFQTRDQHSEIQDEFQIMSTNRESVSSVSSTATTLTKNASSSSIDRDNEIDEADSYRSELSESSSAKERFLEELEDMSHQSCQDLPLEWELTSTVIEAGNFEEEPEHQSVWEVFDGRCIRQDCQELDTLRIQYEQQISSLQRQLEAERRNNQEQMEQRQQAYAELVSTLRTNLDKEQQEKLDDVCSELAKVQTSEIQDLHIKYEHEASIELAALKLSLEQIYISKLQLEMSDLKLRYDQRMDNLNEQHKQDIIRLTTKNSNIDSSINMSTALTKHYNDLIQHISTELESTFHNEQGLTNKEKSVDSDEIVNETDDPSVPSSLSSHDLQNLLLSQQEEITSFRSRLLSEYESLLKDRTEVVQKQSIDVSNLEEQMHDLQQRCDIRLVTMQQKIPKNDSDQSQPSGVQKELFDYQYEELKSYHKKRIHDLESDFEAEINFLKKKHREQVSDIINVKLNEISSEVGIETNHDMEIDSVLSSEHKQYIHKTTSTCDINMYTADTTITAQVELSVHLKHLEAELADRDVQLKLLITRLKEEELRSNSLDESGKELKHKLEELQQQTDKAFSQCSHLQELLLEKDGIITKLEQEKRESEKLYKDILETDSSSQKFIISRDNGSSVDDLQMSDRGDTEDVLCHSDVGKSSNILVVNKENDNSCDLDNSIPFVNTSFDYATDNFNSNNNNNNSSSTSTSLEDLVDSLKKQVKELDKQLIKARKGEAELQKQLEEREYNHKDIIETIKLELEHERQIEVETMQSEFRIQLEIELKKQAMELLQSTETKSSHIDGMIETETLPIKLQTSFEENGDNLTNSVSNSLIDHQSTQKHDECLFMPNDAANSDNDSDTSQEVSEFYLQQATLSEALASSDAVKLTRSDRIISSPAKDDISSPLLTSTLSMTELKNVIDLDKTACQAKITQLEQQLELIQEERSTIIANHQQEIENIRKLLDKATENYNNILEGIQNRDQPDLAKFLKDKYDEELDMAKSVMQKDYDKTLADERKKFVDKHRKLMGDFMEDREKEENEIREKHRKELSELKQTLTTEFEQVLKKYEREIETLNHDLKELRNEEQEFNEELASTADRTLPEIDEITFSFQEMDVNSESPDSQKHREAASTPVEHLHSEGSGVQSVATDAQCAAADVERDEHIMSTLQIRNFTGEPETQPTFSHQDRKDLEFTIQQLIAEVQRLTHLLEDAQRRESLIEQSTQAHSLINHIQNGDESALITMLKSDLDGISAERESVLRTNDRLLSLLSESVKTYVSVEDTINRKLNQVVSNAQTASGHRSDAAANSFKRGSGESMPRDEQTGASGFTNGDSCKSKGASPDKDTSQDSQTMENLSILSNTTDEGLEISHRLAESIFVGPDLDGEGEDILTDARGRLQSAVGQLLDLMERSTLQLMEAKSTQEELLNTLASRAQEMEVTSSRCNALNTQLTAEIEAKEYLGVELHKAEGLISGYSSELETMESKIQSLDEQRERLIIELDTTRSQLQDLQQSQSEVESSREELTHQQQLLRQNTGQEIQAKSQQESSSPADSSPALLGEISTLNQDRKELSNQLQFQIEQAQKRLTEQESTIEESERRHEAAMEERNNAIEDLRLQLENVERQLKASKAFVEEQMLEREQEREEHQREIERFEQMIEGKDKSANSQHRLQVEIADLTEQLQARIASQNELHQQILELQKSLEDKELSAFDLKAWVSQLESELDQRGTIEEQLKQRIGKLEKQLTEKSEDSDVSEDVDEKVTQVTKIKTNSPVVLSPARQSQIRSVSLQEELLRFQRLEEELQHENSALKEQVQQQLLQISGLRNQLDQLRNYGGDDKNSVTEQLRVKLQAERDAVEKYEEKLTEAQNQISSLEHTLSCKDEEAEIVRIKVSKIIEMGDAQEENENLKSQLGELQAQIYKLSSLSSPHSLPPELLEEKNHEIEELQHKMDLLKEELSLKSEGETLNKNTIQELQARLKEKDEEISDLQDNINSLRRGEPCLDVSLPLNDETGFMMSSSMTGRTSIQQELEESIAEKERDLHSLQKELAQARKDVENKEQDLNNLREMIDTFNKEKEKDISDKALSIGLLEDTIQQRDREVYDLTLTNEELKHQMQEIMHAHEDVEKHLEDKETELAQIVEDRDKSLEQLHEKEDKLDQMVLQIDSLQQEISSLTSFQHELQKDFDTVQNMLDEKEHDIENLTKELTDNKLNPEALQTVGNLKKKLASTEAKLIEIKEQFHNEQALNAQLKELLDKEKVTNADTATIKSTQENIEGKGLLAPILEDETDKKDTYQEGIIESLEKELLELKLKAETDGKLWAGMMEKAQEEHAKKVQALEEQLHVQKADSQLELALSDSEQIINSLKEQLDNKSKELEEFLSIKQQLCETEEQLRQRQKVLLKLQADKDQLLLDIEQTVELKQQLEEKDKNLTELEGLMRFRQSCILELAEEKERIIEEMNNKEASLKQQLLDKEKIVLELQKKYDELKRGINEEVLQIEQDIDRSSQAQVIKKTESEKEIEELRWKLLQASDELVDATSKQKQDEEKLSLISKQLMEKDQQVSQLQSQLQILQLEISQSNVASADTKTNIDKENYQDSKDKDEAVFEPHNVSDNLNVELIDTKYKKVREELLSPALSSLSGSLSLQEAHYAAGRIGLPRWDSEPISLSRSLRENVYLQLNMTEVERISRQQKKDLSEKNIELERVRQDLERWLKMGKGQDSLHLIIKEKETQILTLQAEIETIRTVLEEKDQTIVSLKEQLQLLQVSHYEDLSAKDHLVTELQEQIYVFKSGTGNGSSMTSSKNSPLQGQSLSPETKQSISHLKMQLRKAHAALEEMQQGRTDEFEVGGGDAGRLHITSLEKELQELRQTLKVREEELLSLNAKWDKELQNKTNELNAQHELHLIECRKLEENKFEQILTEQKQILEKQHEQEINKLKLQKNVDEQDFHDGADKNINHDCALDGEHARISINNNEMMPGRLQTLLEHLNQLGEHLLSVSDLHYLQQHIVTTRQPDSSDHVAWIEERSSLMDTIDALKDLLKQTDKVVNMSKDDQSDWRAALLYSLIAVFENEQRILKAEVQTANFLYPEIDIIAQIELKIHNLEQIHQFGLDEMLRADRQSLIDEIKDLHHRLLQTHSQFEENHDIVRQNITKLEEAKTSGEWKLNRQIQMLEYKLQQEDVVTEDLKKSLKQERQRVSELSSQTSQERLKILELQSELSATQINLSNVKDALEREQQRFSSVTDALEEERSKTIKLTEMLDADKRKLKSLSEEVAHADVRHQQKVDSEEGYIKELQTELKKERQKSVQFIEAEHVARREITHLSDENDILKRKLSTIQEEYKTEIETLHREQMEKKLHVQLEDKSEVVSKLTELLETERDNHNEAMEHEKSIIRQLKRDMDQLNSESIQVRHIYESEKSRADALKSELDLARSELMSQRKRGGDDITHTTSHKQLRIVEQDREEHTVRENDVSSPGQIGKLREHNQLLTEQVLKLKKEKEKLSDSVKTLEQRLQTTININSNTQVNIPHYISDTASEEESVYDRTVWASERLSLQMALDSAEHEIQRLRTEIQQFKTSISSNIQQSHTDPNKASRLYGKYLRSESFRKALIYQKKYLLLLLGGYRDTEQETLAILASMGGFPSSQVSQHSRTHTRAFTVFRSVGRMVIAIFRMKYLVKRWKRATRVGSPAVTGQINQEHAYIPSSSSFPSHQRHHTETAVHLLQSLNSNMHSSRSSSSCVDYISSLSNNGVSTLGSTTHQGAVSHSYTTPPTKDMVRQHKSAARGNRNDVRRRMFQDEPTALSSHSSARPHRVENDDNFLQYLENVQQELRGGNYGSPLAERHVAWR